MIERLILIFGVLFIPSLATEDNHEVLVPDNGDDRLSVPFYIVPSSAYSNVYNVESAPVSTGPPKPSINRGTNQVDPGVQSSGRVKRQAYYSPCSPYYYDPYACGYYRPPLVFPLVVVGGGGYGRRPFRGGGGWYGRRPGLWGGYPGWRGGQSFTVGRGGFLGGRGGQSFTVGNFGGRGGFGGGRGGRGFSIGGFGGRGGGFGGRGGRGFSIGGGRGGFGGGRGFSISFGRTGGGRLGTRG